MNLVFAYYMTGGLPGFGEFSTFLWFGQDLLHRNYGFYSISWSLCIEEWFYLLFPTALYAFSKCRVRLPVSFFLTLLFFFILFPLIRLALLYNGKGDQLREITFARLDAIAFGVLITYIRSVRNLTKNSMRIMFAAGILCIAMPLFVSRVSGLSLAVLSQNAAMLAIVPLGAALTLPLVSLLKAPSGALGFADVCIEKMSLWSYSIYPSRILILFLLYYLMEDIRNSTAGNLLSKIAGFVATLLVSAFIYHFFEMPLTRKRPRELRTPQPEKENARQ